MSDNEIIQDFFTNAQKMQQNIISSVNDSNHNLELIIRELLVYLDTVTENLESVKSLLNENDKHVAEVIRSVETSKRHIEDGVSSISKINAENTNKLISYLRKMWNANYKYLDAIQKSTRKSLNNSAEILDNVKESTRSQHAMENKIELYSSQLSEVREAISDNQEQFVKIVESMINSSTSLKVEENKIKSRQYETKIQFYGKIVGILAGSGGILYLLIDLMLGG